MADPPAGAGRLGARTSCRRWFGGAATCISRAMRRIHMPRKRDDNRLQALCWLYDRRNLATGVSTDDGSVLLVHNSICTPERYYAPWDPIPVCVP